MSLNLSALADFSNQTAGKIVPNIVYTGNTAEYTSVQEGIKYIEPINIYEMDLYVQSGYTCATEPSGSATFSQRNIQVCGRQVFDSVCLKDLDTKYLGISTLDRGSYNTTWKLTETTMELVTNQMKKSNDIFLWQAVSGSAGACADGLLALTSGSGAGIVAATGIGAQPLTGSTALAQLDTMIELLPTDVADRDDLCFFMSVSNFRKFVSGVRSANSYYFDPNSISNRGGVLDMVYPYQNIRVVGTAGLGSSERIILGPAKQIVVGTDLVSDVDNTAIWYDLNTDSLRWRLSMKLGVNIAFPEYFVSNQLA